MTRISATAYEPLAPAVQADPYPFYAALRADAPTYFVESLDAYAVSRHADVRRVLHDHQTFSSQAMATLVTRPNTYAEDAKPENEEHDPFAVSIIGTDGEQHARLRLIVNRAFTPRRISALESRTRTLARRLLDDLVAQSPVEIQSGYAVPLPTMVIAELLGVPSDLRADFRRWSEHMVRAVFEPIGPDEQGAVASAGDEMGDWLDAEIASRAGSNGDDLISVLMGAELEGGALTRNELHVFVFTLLIAGSITTAYLVGTTLEQLAINPQVCAAVRSDPERIPEVVEEALRYDAPTQMMFRTAVHDVGIGDTTIPAGATILALLGSANRDETVFPDPDRFDPQRASTDHLAFGHGAHFCLGAALARLEARVCIAELLTRAPRLQVVGEPERVESLVFRGPTRLELDFG